MNRSKGYSDEERRMLRRNPFILNVSEKSITYDPAFKLAAVQAYEEGLTPMEIFVQAGFNVNLIGRRKPKACLKRWRDIYAAHGPKALLEERRGMLPAEHPKSRRS
ncbi:hypothetical protein KIH86_00330 [Paenibacillus sp. HN-1]|uniref:HTH domain-containing protein n=1 Tax=Paenibacillus TaxID=44249 RepID=UPI001CA9899D|nr:MULTISPECIES: HTH domain-containing protein [Paenibacillus]MBY9082111.1 hypothetical protein [Paenibacillus sp. CGMCC 1.18879]MBY9082693.1 hypothetical protein [Paenibacillus sinensis]